MEIIVGIFALLAVGMAWQDGRRRTCGFLGALIICFITTPIFGYFIVLLFPLKEPKGCKWCGNKENEAEYCGVCGKNEAGELRSTLQTN